MGNGRDVGVDGVLGNVTFSLTRHVGFFFFELESEAVAEVEVEVVGVCLV